MPQQQFALRFLACQGAFALQFAKGAQLSAQSDYGGIGSHINHQLPAGKSWPL
jgi:hypothetical protein